MTIELRGRTETHVRIYFERTQDEEIRHMCPQKAKTAEEAIADYRKTLEENVSSFGRTVYAGGKYVGDVWLYCIDEDDHVDAMLSFCLFEKELWGRGIMTEAVRLFLEETEKRFSLRTVGAFTFTDNVGSRRVLTKNGFALQESFFEDGRESCYFERRIYQ